MRIKEGVNLEGVQWQLFKAAIIAESIYQKYGAECVITSGNDGSHKEGSLHYSGKALDLRTWNLHGREVQVCAELKKALGDEYDVILEGGTQPHIHVEHDPKVIV